MSEFNDAPKLFGYERNKPCSAFMSSGTVLSVGGVEYSQATVVRTNSSNKNITPSSIKITKLKWDYYLK